MRISNFTVPIIISLVALTCSSAPADSVELSDATTGWRLVEVASYTLPTRAPYGFPMVEYFPGNFIVFNSPDRGPGFMTVTSDLAFEPDDFQRINSIFYWDISESPEEYYIHRRTYLEAPGYEPFLYSHQPIFYPGAQDFAVTRFSRNEEYINDPSSQDYRLELLVHSREEGGPGGAFEYNFIDIPSPPLYNAFFDMNKLVCLNEPGDYQTLFCYMSSQDLPERVYVVNLEDESVLQPFADSDSIPSDGTLVAYDYLSGNSIWFEVDLDDQYFGFIFQNAAGERTSYNILDIGLDLDLITPTISNDINEIPLLSRINWHTNMIDGEPIAYFRFFGTYLAMKMIPDQQIENTVLWNTTFDLQDPYYSEKTIGRINPSPEAGPGDCWVLWDQNGEIQIIDLGAGKMIFNGELETTPYININGESKALGQLVIGDIDGSLPQELCWWDAGAWTLRIYRLMPPV